MKKSDIGVVAVIYAIVLFFLIQTLQLQKSTQIYPLFILATITLLNTLYVLRMFKAYKTIGIVSSIEDFEGFVPKQFLVVLAGIVLYIFSMSTLGFYISSAIFLVGILLFLKVPKLHIVLTTVFVLLLVYLAFTKFLGVRLPAGIIF